MSYCFVGADGPLTGRGLEELLADDDPIWAMADLVDGLDLSTIEAAYRADGSGGRAYDPRLMLTVILHCYRLGIRSPAGIERACRARIDLQILLGGRIPAGRTMGAFVTRHHHAISVVFVQVLALCDLHGLIDPTVTATDGSPVRAAASLSANRTLAWIGDQLDRVDDYLDELTAQTTAAADALDPDIDRLTPDPDTDLDEYIALVCEQIPAQAKVAHRRLTKLRAAEQVAIQRTATRRDAETADRDAQMAKAAAWPPHHEAVLAKQIAAQDAKVAAYTTRAAHAAERGRRPDGRAPTPTDQCKHITRQRQALANAAQRLVDLQHKHHL
jgi:transposase